MNEIYEISNEKKEELVREMKTVLEDVEWQPETYALRKIINQWLERKNNLLSILSKHPNWDPDRYYIHFDTDYTREFDTSEMSMFIDFLTRVYRKMTPDEQKKANDLICEKASGLNINGVINELGQIGCVNSSQLIEVENIELFSEFSKEREPKAGQKVSRYLNKVLTDMGIDKWSYKKIVYDTEGNAKEVDYKYTQAFNVQRKQLGKLPHH